MEIDKTDELEFFNLVYTMHYHSNLWKTKLEKENQNRKMNMPTKNENKRIALFTAIQEIEFYGETDFELVVQELHDFLHESYPDIIPED